MRHQKLLPARLVMRVPDEFAQVVGAVEGQLIDNDLSIINAMLGIGKQQQNQQQQSALLAYQDFLRQQGWSEEQLSIFSEMLSAIPMGQTTTQTQQQQSNPLAAIISMMSLLTSI